MTAREFIDYILANNYDDYNLVIDVDGEWVPVDDAAGIAGYIKMTVAGGANNDGGNVYGCAPHNIALHCL